MKTPEDEAFEELERRIRPVKKPQDEIFAMAKEAGFMQHLGVICIPNIQNLEAFAKLVAEAEREACAAKAEQVGQHKNHIGIAAAIRARGRTHD